MPKPGMTGITSRINARAKSASPLAPALLCLFLLFSQSADLVHNHDGSLLRQFDCDICHSDGVFVQWPEGIQRE